MNLPVIIFSAIVLSSLVIGNYIGFTQVKGDKKEMVRSVIELPPTYTPTPTPTSQSKAATAEEPTEIPTPTVIRIPTNLPTPQVILSEAVIIQATTTPTPTKVSTTPTPTFVPTQTPTPTPILPTPTRVTASAGEIDSYFEKYSREYSVDISLLRKIAVCESGYNTNSKSKYGYAGMFQFSESAWRGIRNRMGLDTNPDLRFNPEESIKAAAYKISKDGTGAWPACSK